MRFSIYPWSIQSWRSAFRASGLHGVALFFLLLGTMLQVADTTGGGAGHSNATGLILIRMPAIVFAFVVLMIQPRIASVRFTDLRFAYGAFACMYLASALWSQVPIQTIGKGAELVLAGLVFFEASRPGHITGIPIPRVEGLRQIVLLTMSTLGMLAVLGFALRLSAFIQHRAGLISSTTAQAPFLSGNGLGYVSSALILVVFAEWMGRRLPAKAALGQLIFALALFSVSASRTSLGILLLSVLLVLFKRSKLLGALAVSTAALSVFVFWSQIQSHLQGNQTASNFETLSGRTVVWTAALHQFEAHPVLGVGGGIGGKIVIAHIGNRYLEEMSSLHNGFLEVLTGLGFVGFLLGTYMLLMTTLRAWSAWSSNPEFAGTYVLIIHVWMTTIMSTGILGWMGYEVAIFLCILTNIDLVRERARANAAVEAMPVRWSALLMTPRNRAFG